MKKLALLSAFIATQIVSGCALLERGNCTPNCRSQTRNSSSLVSFLYPDGAAVPQQDAVPVLPVPLRVGLAFLPPQMSGDIALDEAHKQDLLEHIRRRFADRKFVAEIVVIPDYYLKTNKGYSGLEGIQRLYNIDLMALVSYDQVTYTDDNKWSLSYVTIVGAYAVKGTANDVTTLVDLAVVDPKTQSLVLRAGGTDTRHRNSTLINVQRDARAESVASFDAATTQMIGNFDNALLAFESDVHNGKANVHVVARNGSGGGGGAGTAGDILGLLGLLAACRIRAGRTTPVSGSRP